MARSPARFPPAPWPSLYASCPGTSRARADAEGRKGNGRETEREDGEGKREGERGIWKESGGRGKEVENVVGSFAGWLVGG